MLYEMKGISIGFAFCLLTFALSAQTVQQKLQKAYQQFEADSQLKHAISSLYVIDAVTGEVLFDKNSQIGLAGASTQKIVTAATAFELLGKDFRYATKLVFSKDLHLGYERYLIVGSGDPTFGSWRYKSTSDTAIFNQIYSALISRRIKHIGTLMINDDINDIPGGWIWEDIGNYYGAGSSNFNWRENQYDIKFKSGKTGYKTEVIDVSPAIPDVIFNNQVRSGPEGSGDNAYIYFSISSDTILIQGTVPPNREAFSISGTMPESEDVFLYQIADYFLKAKPFPVGISKIIRKPFFGSLEDRLSGIDGTSSEIIYTHFSPTLDSIIYWFLKKSINLYGESLIKTFNDLQTGMGPRDTGIARLRKFWAEKGIDEDELNLYDGSGLSPLNRITTHAQVGVLKYAKTRNWFSSFYSALPDYNGMKMKSGTINDVKGFCGYHVSKEGKEYIFSFLVNNYNGKASSLVNKMYKVLDELK
jgi:D-alanyl-D-alanine carboxypeptidase/D-alanyl-D-alanine-endopeptidase (penicillin-binding protein 4)